MLRQLDGLPGGEPEVTVGNSFSVVINSHNEVAFGVINTNTATPPNNVSLLSDSKGEGLRLVARNGTQPPGTEPGVYYAGFAVFGPNNETVLINGNGNTAFGSALGGNGVEVTINRDALFREDSDNGLQLVARSGQPAPGTWAGVVFDDFREDGIGRLMLSLNGADQLAFSAQLSGPGVDGSNNTALFAEDADGNVQLIVREGDQLDVSDDPLTPDLRTVVSFNFQAGTGNEDGRRSAFNDLGQLAFSATFTDGASGIFVSNAVATLAGDYNNDGQVDAADYTVWRDHFGSPADTLPNDVDGGPIGAAQYQTWRQNFGATLGGGPASAAAVPEPNTILLAGAACLLRPRRRSNAAA